MNMGKTVLAQRNLVNFCRHNGYTDMKFIGVDCVSAVNKSRNKRRFNVNSDGEIIGYGYGG